LVRRVEASCPGGPLTDEIVSILPKLGGNKPGAEPRTVREGAESGSNWGTCPPKAETIV